MPAGMHDRTVGLDDGAFQGEVLEHAPEEGGEAFAGVVVEGVVDLGALCFLQWRWSGIGIGGGIGSNRRGMDCRARSRW